MLQANQIKRTTTITPANHAYLSKIVKWNHDMPNFSDTNGATAQLVLPDRLYENVSDVYADLLGNVLDEELDGDGDWSDDYYLDDLIIDEIEGVGIKLVAMLQHNLDPEVPATYIIIDPQE